jgi:hypothetical protein
LHCVVHAQNHTGDREAGVELGADQFHGFEELAHPLERQEMCLHRDDDLARGGKGVDGQHAQGGRTVDQHELEPRRELLKGVGKAVVTIGEGSKLRFCRREICLAGDDEEIRPGLDQGGRGLIIPVKEQVVDRSGRGRRIDAERKGGVGLRVEVDDERRVAARGKSSRKVHGGRGLTDAPLLVDESNDAGCRMVGDRASVLDMA